MSELIIGVDVGFGNTKTSHKVFSSGVIKHSTKPPISSMVVETNEGFYSVGNPKITIQESKMNNEDMLVLTEAAIAEELKMQGMTQADIHLGVGVPLTRMGAEKEPMVDYYKRNRKLVFKYEDVTYSINLLSINVYPQGYAGIVNYINKFSRLAVVIDIGITCMHKINEHLREQFNGEADEILLKDVMITGSSIDLPPKYLTVIQNDLKTYVEDIMGQLRALQFNLDTTQLIFIGGGSTIIKNFLDAEKYPKATVIDDVHINAKGYEDLIRYQIRNGGLK